MENDEQKPGSVTSDSPETGEHIDRGRRSFTKIGSVTVAVLMTVANRPTMGGVTGKLDQRCTWSAWMSAGSGFDPVDCGGNTTTYWLSKYDRTNRYCWPRPHLASGGCDGTGYPTIWPNWNYKPTDNTPMYSSVCGSSPLEAVYTQGFTPNQITDPSLYEVLKSDPDGTKLQSQFCAALLNAADSNCLYGYSVTDVVKLYKDNVGSDPDGLYNMFKTLNSRG